MYSLSLELLKVLIKQQIGPVMATSILMKVIELCLKLMLEAVISFMMAFH